jgi:hypothetical protein
MTRCFSTAALARQNQHDSESEKNCLCDILKYTKFVSVKTQLYLDKRVCVFESATYLYFNLGYVILKLRTILKTHNGEENVEVHISFIICTE